MKNLIKLVIVMSIFSNLAWANKMTPMQEARLGTPSLPILESQEKYVQETIFEIEYNDAEVIQREQAFYGRQGLMCDAGLKLVIKSVNGKEVSSKECIKLASPEQLNKNFKLEDSRRYEIKKQNMFLDIQKGERTIPQVKQF
jgi:hypothetical protein